jgi:uncharacterized repeat protein (TIGR01451 family)
VKLASALLSAIVIAALAPSGAAAAVFSVTNTNDVVAANPGSGSCATAPGSVAAGACTLRSAVQAANNVAGPSTINVAAGTYKLTIAPTGTSDASTGNLNITNTTGIVTIAGAGSGSTIIDGNFLDRVFNVAGSASAAISGVTIRNGRPGGLGNVTSCPGSPGATASGGGILASGTLTLSNDVVSGNMSSGSGGGIETNGVGAVKITATTVSGNVACQSNFNQANDWLGFGAGIDESAGANVTIDASTISGNTTKQDGGGAMELGGGTMTVTNSTISGNSAAAGAGVAGESDGLVKLFADTLTGNTASNQGGGVYESGTPFSIVNTTITANSAADGGGIYSQFGSTTVSYSTITSNSASQGTGNLRVQIGEGSGHITLDDSIVTRGIGTTGTPSNCNPTAGFTSGGHNLFDDTSDSGAQCAAVASDVINADAKLGPLQDNGGPTHTVALLTGSPAIDTADNSKCPETNDASMHQVDQRGVSRPVGSACDIGAYEYERADLALAASASAARIYVGQQDTFTDRITNSGPSSATNTVFTDPAPAGFTVNSVTTTQGSCTHTTHAVSCKLGTVANGATVTVRIVVTASSPGALSLTSSVTMDLTDPTPADNRQTVTVTVIALSADLGLTKRAAPSRVIVGQRLTYTLTVTNHGPNTDTGVKVIDALPDSVRLISSKASKGRCSGTTKVTCSLGTLAVRAHATVTIVVSARQAGRIVNTGSVTGKLHDPNLRNNQATASATARIGICPALRIRDTYDLDDPIVKVQVYLAGRLIQTLRGSHLSRTIMIRNLPAHGTFRFRAVFTGNDTRQGIVTRTFTNCVGGATLQSKYIPPGAPLEP